MATPMVRAFLTWLLLGVVLATAMRRADAPAPPAWLHVPLVMGSGLALGPWPHPLSHALLAGYGLMLLVATIRMRASFAERALWLVLGAGFLAVALGGYGEHHLVAISGIHFAVLGPVMVSMAWPRAWAHALPAYAASVGVFALAILGPVVWPWTGWPRISAIIGTLLAIFWILRAFGWLWTTHLAPSSREALS